MWYLAWCQYRSTLILQICNFICQNEKSGDLHTTHDLPHNKIVGCLTNISQSIELYIKFFDTLSKSMVFHEYSRVKDKWVMYFLGNIRQLKQTLSLLMSLMPVVLFSWWPVSDILQLKYIPVCPACLSVGCLVVPICSCCCVLWPSVLDVKVLLLFYWWHIYPILSCQCS